MSNTSDLAGLFALPYADEACRQGLDVWFCPSESPLGRVAREYYWSLLDPEEIAVGRRFTSELQQDDYLQAHALMRQVLSHYAHVPPRECRFMRDDYGRPSLIFPAIPTIDFNLSHCPGAAVCAVSRTGGQVGVDLEPYDVHGSLARVSDRFFAAVERAWLRGLAYAQGQRSALELWVLKEAYVKAVGKGLSMPLDSFAINIAPDQPPELASSTQAQLDERWNFSTIDVDKRYFMATATSGLAPVAIRVFTFDSKNRVVKSQDLSESARRHWQIQSCVGDTMLTDA